jgi:SAM-dependent methyltransferase
MIDDLIVCPICHSDLPLNELRQDGSAQCQSCHYVYSFQEAFDLTPIPPPDDMVRGRWRLWEDLQSNFEKSYAIEPSASLSVGERADARLFAEFGEWTGTVLDIGCGPQSLPSYATGYTGRFVGIDPLMGFPVRQFDFVKGLAEFLPFRDATFDRILFATSLDHLLNPLKSIQEARRVVKPDGQVLIWYGLVQEPDRKPRRNLIRKGFNLIRQGNWREISQKIRRLAGKKPALPELPAYLQGLDVPPGAIDPFHAYLVEENTLTDWLRSSGLNPVEWKIERQETKSCFVRALPAG